MNQALLLACAIIFGEGIVILYLLGMVKDATKDHAKALKSVTEDVLLTLKANNAFELSQSRAFQKDQDILREKIAETPSIPFDPTQAGPTPNTIPTKDGRELQILRPRSL